MAKSLVLPKLRDSTTTDKTCEQNVEKSGQMGNFEDALRKIMQVSKEDLKKIQAEEEAEKADKPKRGPKPKSK
jgi:hypothetical protein